MLTHTNESKLYTIIDNKSTRTFQAPDMLPFELCIEDVMFALISTLSKISLLTTISTLDHNLIMAFSAASSTAILTAHFRESTSPNGGENAFSSDHGVA